MRQLHVRISEHVTAEKKRALFLGTVDNFDDLSRLLDRFGVTCMLVDYEPSGRLRARSPPSIPAGVWRIAYAPNMEKLIEIDEDPAGSRRCATPRRWTPRSTRCG